MSDYGIKVANENSNISSESLADYEFWTKHPMVKIKKSGSGTATLTVSGGDGSFSIEIDDNPTSFTPMIFAKADVYTPLGDTVIEDRDIPYRESSSTGLLFASYVFSRESGKIFYRGQIMGGTNGTYNLDYEYIILYDKVDV